MPGTGRASGIGAGGVSGRSGGSRGGRPRGSSGGGSRLSGVVPVDRVRQVDLQVEVERFDSRLKRWLKVRGEADDGSVGEWTRADRLDRARSEIGVALADYIWTGSMSAAGDVVLAILIEQELLGLDGDLAGLIREVLSRAEDVDRNWRVESLRLSKFKTGSTSWESDRKEIADMDRDIGDKSEVRDENK